MATKLLCKNSLTKSLRRAQYPPTVASLQKQPPFYRHQHSVYLCIAIIAISCVTTTSSSVSVESEGPTSLLPGNYLQHFFYNSYLQILRYQYYLENELITNNYNELITTNYQAMIWKATKQMRSDSDPLLTDYGGYQSLHIQR